MNRTAQLAERRLGSCPAHFVGGDLAKRDDDLAVIRLDARLGPFEKLARACGSEPDEVETTGNLI